MPRTWTLWMVPALLTACAGCLESQSRHPDRLAVIEQRQIELADTFDTEHARIELATLKLKDLEKHLETMNERIEGIIQRLDTLAQIPEHLDVSLNQDRIAIKSLRSDLGIIRGETAAIVRIQNESIAKSQEIYSLIMQREVETLTLRLEELNRTLEALKKLNPKMQAELDRAVETIVGPAPTGESNTTPSEPVRATASQATLSDKSAPAENSPPLP